MVLRSGCISRAPSYQSQRWDVLILTQVGPWTLHVPEF